MMRFLPISLAAFLTGGFAGSAGLLIALHHIREPLSQSVHYLWYDWFMYMAYPGFYLASFFFDPYIPASRNFGLPAIAFANGVIAALFTVLFSLSLFLARKSYGKASR